MKGPLYLNHYWPTLALLLCMVAGIVSTASAQKIRFVSPTGTTAPASATTSWATSTSDLQGAIDASNANDEVWVKAGLYKPTTGTNQSISFSMKQGVKIYGGFAGTETTLTGPAGRTLTTPSSTTLSGELGSPASTSDNSYHVISNLNLTNTALLDGFVITGGAAAGGPTMGGGMYNDASSPTLVNCLFLNNYAYYRGGGMYNVNSSSPRLTNCQFKGNFTATYIPASTVNAVDNSGGGIYNNGGNPVLTDCLFEGNYGINNFGGGMYSTSGSSYTMVNCTFRGNSAYVGGGVYNDNNSSPAITGCTFESNTVAVPVSASAAARGAGMVNATNSNAKITNCLFLNNVNTDENGGGLYNSSSSPVIVGTTFQGNRAPGSGAVYNFSSPASFSACLFLNNSAGSGGAMGNTSSNTPMTSCTFTGNSATTLVGGAISMAGSSPIITDCIFQNNSAVNGGAISISSSSNPTITNSVFRQNTAATQGGALRTFVNSSATVRNCTFVSNSVSAGGGGALYSTNTSTLSFTACVFQGNSAAMSGGVIENVSSSTFTAVLCDFRNNTAADGGVIYNSFGASRLINSSFQSNSATASGGVMVNNGSTVPVINCSFQGNSATVGGVASSTNSTVSLNSCVIFGNGGANTLNGFTFSARYSLFDQSVTGYSNTTANIQTTVTPFASATGTELSSTAPAINAADPATTTATVGTTDLAGNNRFFGRLDMGAYEDQTPVTLTVTNPAVTTANTNAAFSQTFTASNGTAPYTFSLASGSLPAGLTLAQGGVLSGTPTQTGNFTITVLATDVLSNTGVGAAYSLTVSAIANVSLSLTAAPNPALPGQPVTYTVQVANTGPGISLSTVVQVSVPAGLHSLTVNGPGSWSNSFDAGTGLLSFTNTTGLTAGSTTTISFGLTPSASAVGTTPVLTASVTTSATDPDPGNNSAGVSTTITSADLADLGVSTGTLTPAFAGSITSYSLSGCNSATSLTITPTVLDARATIQVRINGGSYSAVSSGVPTGPLVMQPGVNVVTVLVTAQGGVATQTYSLTILQRPVVSLSPSSATISCASPVVTLTATGGLTSYSFSTGQNGTGNTVAVSSAGTYSVIATAANGCTNVASATVVSTSVVISASLVAGGAISCTSASVTLTASPANLSYSFGSGAVQIGSTNQATVSAAGTYSVIVSNAGGCSAVAQVTVSDNSTPASVTISPESLTLNCASPSVSLSAIGNGNVVWSTLETTAVISVTTAGVYSVTLTNAANCKAVSSVTITGGALQQVNVSVDGPIACNNAVVTIQGGGAGSFTLLGPQNYSVTNNTGLFTVSAAGSYTGIAASQPGCSSTGIVTVIDASDVPSATNFRASGTLGAGNCRVQLLGNGTGSLFEMTGPGGYVFSNIHRCPGSYAITGQDVLLPGTYTLRVYSGGHAPVTYTTVVTGTACSSGR